METSFAVLFRTWFLEQQGNEELARRLAALSDQAWEFGDRGDRGDLMRFIYLRKDSALFHYLIEALGCADRDLEIQAMGYIASLAMKGHGFTSQSRSEIAEFGRREPDLQSLAEYVLELLEENDSRYPPLEDY